MKKTFFLLVFIFGFQVNAQLTFWNIDANSNIPKFEVEQNAKTIVFSKIGNNVKPLYTFNKTAPQIHNGDGRTKYQMTVETSDSNGKIKFEINYTFYRQTNCYLGNIKTTYTYLDKRPTKIKEDNFETKTIP